MAQRLRVAPRQFLSQPAETGYLTYSSAAELIARRGGYVADPVHALRPHIITQQAQLFLRHFPGTPMYAVKVNPDKLVLQTIADAGFTAFDCASLAEIAAVRAVAPSATIYFMHPVKARHAITEAYYAHGVRHFSLDSADEFAKIMQATNNAADLHLHVRLAVAAENSFHALTHKFGADEVLAAELLGTIRPNVKGLGLCFHVGSQTMGPAAYASALQTAWSVVQQAGVAIDSIDVGGGFPVCYPGMTPPPLTDYFTAIKTAITALNLPATCQVLAEPGRALVAEAGRLICRVELRKGDKIYLNDGGYGSLFDSVFTGLTYPAIIHKANGQKPSSTLAPITFYGPTCDSIDECKTPFMLPACIGEGDIIEFCQTGAYSHAMQSAFNGFTANEVVVFSK